MKKNMYSLMLAEDVVREVDRLAAESRTNRSNLVNQILAEYVSLVTPEKRVRNIFDVVESLLVPRGSGMFSLGAGGMTMSYKSALSYNYRPTIRYEVEMYATPRRTIGQLKVVFRTTAADLIVELTAFFRLWMRLEELYVGRYFGDDGIEYGLDSGRFTRKFALPAGREYSEAEMGEAIGGYIAAFDDMLKNYLAGKYRTAADAESDFVRRLDAVSVII